MACKCYGVKCSLVFETYKSTDLAIQVSDLRSQLRRGRSLIIIARLYLHYAGDAPRENLVTNTLQLAGRYHTKVKSFVFFYSGNH